MVTVPPLHLLIAETFQPMNNERCSLLDSNVAAPLTGNPSFQHKAVVGCLLQSFMLKMQIHCLCFFFYCCCLFQQAIPLSLRWPRSSEKQLC
ncbi:hypothetical protein XENTR_v10022075 [Xenopus tropicalis]|nr:hypothetical protein XENTR_v10022075 [Xenopus tropicalis]